MDGQTTVLLAALGIVSASVAGLMWILKYMFTRLLPRLDKGNVAFDKIVTATKSNTEATKSADKYLRERNGRDAEIHKELVEAVKEIPAQIIKTADVTAKALKEAPKVQKIDKQEVKTQIVNGNGK